MEREQAEIIHHNLRIFLFNSVNSLRPELVSGIKQLYLDNRRIFIPEPVEVYINWAEKFAQSRGQAKPSRDEIFVGRAQQIYERDLQTAYRFKYGQIQVRGGKGIWEIINLDPFYWRRVTLTDLIDDEKAKVSKLEKTPA